MSIQKVKRMENIFKRIPPWGWVLAAIGGIGIGLMIIRKQNVPATEEVPYVFPQAAPTTDVYGDSGKTELIVIPTPTPIQSSQPASNDPVPPRQPDREPERPRTQKIGIIRARHSHDWIAGVKQWDDKFPGVPRRATPSPQAAQIDLVPFSSTVQISGPSVTGGNNLPQQPELGSIMWYPTTRGYINKFDLETVYDANISTEGSTTQSNTSTQTQTNG